MVLNTNVSFSESPSQTTLARTAIHPPPAILTPSLHCLHSAFPYLLFSSSLSVFLHQNVSSRGAGILSIPFTLNLLCLEQCLAHSHRLYAFPRAAIATYHTLEGLKQQTLFFTVLELAIRSQGVGRTKVSLKVLGKTLPCLILAPWFVATSLRFLLLSSHNLLPLCLCFEISIFIRASR